MVQYEVTAKQGDRVTIRLAGQMAGERSVEEFKEALEEHYVDDGVKQIRVDVSEVELITLDGLGVLIVLWKESKARGKRFVVEDATGQVREKLKVTGTLGLLESETRSLPVAGPMRRALERAVTSNR